MVSSREIRRLAGLGKADVSPRSLACSLRTRHYARDKCPVYLVPMVHCAAILLDRLNVKRRILRARPLEARRYDQASSACRSLNTRHGVTPTRGRNRRTSKEIQIHAPLVPNVFACTPQTTPRSRPSEGQHSSARFAPRSVVFKRFSVAGLSLIHI